MAKNMTEGASLKLLLSFMVPLLIGNVFQQFYNIADIIIVGRTIGVEALASVGAATPLFMLLIVVTMGLTNGFTVITGQFYGANDYENMRKSVATSTILSGIAVVLFTVLIMIVINPVLHAMNVPADLFEDAKSYVVIIGYGLFAMVAYNLLSGIMRALGDSKTPLYFLIIATIVNIFLALLFIIKFGWGVPGSAVALVISQGVSAVLCLLYIWKKVPVLHIEKHHWQWDKEFAKAHLKLAIPMAAQFSVMGLGMIFIQSVCNKFGATAIAAFTSAMRVEQLALQPMISFGVAMAVFSAQNYGARRFDRIRTAVKQCSILAVSFAMVAAVAIYFFSEDIVKIFIESDAASQNLEVITMAEEYLHMSVPFYFFLSQLFIFRGAIQGMGIGMVPLISSSIELVLRTTAAMYLASFLGYTGICYASPISWTFSALFLAANFYYFINVFEKKEQIVIPE